MSPDRTKRAPTEIVVLWVDDHPQSNAAVRRTLAAFGILTTCVHSTRQALVQLKNRHFAAIISDMERWEGQAEGYALLEQVRLLGISTPYFIYAGSSKPEHVQEALSRGANGCTNEHRTLVELIRAAVANAG
jgi:CheY-like chemotaxis protein